MPFAMPAGAAAQGHPQGLPEAWGIPQHATEGPGTTEGEGCAADVLCRARSLLSGLFVRHQLHSTAASDLLTKLIFKSQQESLSFRVRLYKQMNAQGTQFGRQQ